MKIWNFFRVGRRACGLTLGLLAASSTGWAAASGASPDGLYEMQATPSSARGQKPALVELMDSQPFTADIERIRAILARATPEDPNVAPSARSFSPRQRVELSFPMPSGGRFARFEVEEIAIMHPALGAKYPAIKTYRGRSLDDPRATLALDVTPTGMHAQIRSADSTIYIDPSFWVRRVYASYYKADILPKGWLNQFFCETPGDARR